MFSFLCNISIFLKPKYEKESTLFYNVSELIIEPITFHKNCQEVSNKESLLRGL